MSSSSEWRQYHRPIGDDYEIVYEPKIIRVGYSRALHNWMSVRSVLSSIETSGSAYKPSLGQLHSLRLLEEWWQGENQQASLTTAAIKSLQTAAAEDEGQTTWRGYASRRDAKLSESTYHSYMFILFEFEFVVEVREQLAHNPSTFPSALHQIRSKCSSLAALQRAAAETMKLWPLDGAQSQSGLKRPLLDALRTAIPVSVHPCPWLYSGGTNMETEAPHFLWDVKNRRTVVVSQLPQCPEYVCVSHTWGRWWKKEDGPLRIPGVDWLVPQNSKFEVTSLPDQLANAFENGYVWFDLLCIPQDGSELGAIEISRQALIFRKATSVIAWLNDVTDWNVMRNIVSWYSLFYLHTNVNVQAGELPIPDMPQAQDTSYPGMELYDWSTGSVSSISVVSGKPVDENLKIAAPMPWFTSLWTLQEVCFRPGLVLCDKLWRPLNIGETIITLDALVTYERFISEREFAKSVTRPDVDKMQNTESTLPTLTRDLFSGISQPPGCSDLGTLFLDTHIAQILTINAASILSFGRFRQCTSRRGQAIMAVVGATDWYTDHVKQFKKPPPETDLVFELYPLAFVQEAAQKIGATFFTSSPTELRYLQDLVDLETGLWSFPKTALLRPVGSMLPFTQAPGYLRPPVSPTQQEQPHPSVQHWKINQDGSVHITQVGMLAITGEDQIEAIVLAPLYDEDEKISYDTMIDMMDQVNLGGWLEDFSNPQVAPNFAVSLFQAPKLTKDRGGGMHTGLLLKCCGYDSPGGQMRLVKVGMFFLDSIDIKDVATFKVDWLVM